MPLGRWDPATGAALRALEGHEDSVLAVTFSPDGRNGMRSLSDEGRCHFILAGFWSLYRSASFDYQSPLKNFAETVQVGALEPDACRELAMALGLGYESDTIVDRILERTGARASRSG